MMLSDRKVEAIEMFSDFSDLIDAINRFDRERAGRMAAKMSKKPFYEETLQVLKDFAERERIPMAIVGGSTAEIDMVLVVGINDFEKIVKVCYKYGIKIVSFNPSGFHVLKYKKVKIEVIQEGSFGNDPDHPECVPSPEELGVESGLGLMVLAA